MSNSPPMQALDPDSRLESRPIQQPVLVVDDDETFTTLLRDFIEAMGGTEIEIALDGEAAWSRLTQKDFKLIILDWKLPKVTGLVLFSRIRQHPSYGVVPICISSGLLTRQDCFLLQEFPGTGLLEKPYTEELFTERIKTLVEESKWHASNLAILDNLIGSLSTGGERAFAELQQMLKTAPNAVPCTINAAKIMREHGRYREAEVLLTKALEMDPNSVLAMSELGKALHCQGEFERAYQILTKAQGLSPKNLQRLCLMGEIELTLANGEAAATHFKQALSIDREDGKAKAGLLSAENVKGLPPEQRGSIQMLKSMAGLLNITAISLIKQGQHDKGIEQYKAALHFLDDDQDKARIAFNLGLGYLRSKQVQEAATWFQQSLTYSKGQFTKARECLARLTKTKAKSGDQVKVLADEIEFIPL